jgi:hypothetical protein
MQDIPSTSKRHIPSVTGVHGGDLNVTFKRPATVGKKLRLVTKELPDSKSQRAFKAGGTLTDESDAVVATAEAIDVPLDPAASSEFFRRMSFEGSGVSASHFEGRAAAGRADG